MLKKIKKIADLVLVVGFLGFVFVMPMMTCTIAVRKALRDPRHTIEYVSEKVGIFMQRQMHKNDPINPDTKTINTRPAQKNKKENLSALEHYKNLSNFFEKAVQKVLYRKYDFINLDGAVTRCLGIKSLNDVQKLRNGFLTGFSDVKNIEESSQNVIALNKFLSDRGIPFLYVLAPSKNAMYDQQFVPGFGDDSKQNLTNMIGVLNAAGVETINMDDWFKENGWRMDEVLFKTDHHWKPEAGYAAARCTMELLQKKGIAKYDEEKLREESYRKDVLKNWFLGSQGKRTGQYYGGVDDITIYYPKFETDYFYAGLRKDTTNWEFSESVLDLSYAEKKDYFRKNPYDIYMYRDYPLRITINTKALNEKNLLLMGDSFKMMAEYFLTTQFRKVHTIDLRYNTDINFAQYFEEIRPDIVIMCLNVGGTDNEDLHSFGVDEYLASLEKTDPASPVHSFGDFEIRAGENNEKFVGVCGNLEPNQAYTLTVDRTALSGVEHSFLQMTLQNLSTNRAIFNRYFESNSGARQKWIFTTPEGDDAYGIFLYAGTKGHTSGIDAKVEGIALRKGIFED